MKTSPIHGMHKRIKQLLFLKPNINQKQDNEQNRMKQKKNDIVN